MFRPMIYSANADGLFGLHRNAGVFRAADIYKNSCCADKIPIPDFQLQLKAIFKLKLYKVCLITLATMLMLAI